MFVRKSNLTSLLKCESGVLVEKLHRSDCLFMAGSVH